MSNTGKNRGYISAFLTGIICLVLMILAVSYCSYQKVYVVEKLGISGNKELSRQDITGLSGIRLGETIFSADLDAAAEALMLHPYIRYAYISRQFPNQINIHIVERKPVAHLIDDKHYAVDQYAVLLPQTRQEDFSGPVIFADGLAERAVPGYRLDSRELQEAVAMLNYVDFAHPRVKNYCQELIWTEDRGWIMSRDGFPSVFLGKTDLNRRADVLRAFLGTMEKEDKDIKDLRYISLRFNHKVFVREKS